jgi:drug/metabolite transporter (DMT)-like permease
LALAGVLSISFSAVFVRLAAVSPVTATFFRAAYAVPVLALIVVIRGAGGARSRRDRLVAFGSGVLLAVDLAFWHQSIALIGVGLATVIANVQVVFVGVLAWILYGERPTRHLTLLTATVMVGLVLTSGLGREDAYGSAPILGAAYGVLAGASYAGFLLMFRTANRALLPPSAPLLDATLGVVLGALLVSPADAGFSFALTLPAHAWLVALALVSQVAGWMFISTALPRLPAIETSILLLAQPVFALAWGVLFFDEHLSIVQWLGSLLVLSGVATAARTARNNQRPS